MDSLKEGGSMERPQLLTRRHENQYLLDGILQQKMMIKESMLVILNGRRIHIRMSKMRFVEMRMVQKMFEQPVLKLLL